MPSFLQKVGPTLLPPLATALCRTLDIRVTNFPPPQKGPYVIAFWHGSMFAPWWLHRNSRAVGLASNSPDGAVLSCVLERWGYKMIRGSSSQSGSEALAEMVAAITMGYSLLITPDGPRGPRYEMKRGAVLAAQRSGRPLVLVGVDYARAKSLRGWDKFEIPHPWSRVRAIYSDPMMIPRELSGESFEAAVAQVGRELQNLSKPADAARIQS